MKQIDRTKVCWNCEADVSNQATYCPFCGTDLLTSSSSTANKQTPPPQDTKFAQQSLQESLASLYKPPYSVRNRQGLGVPDEREESALSEVEKQDENPLFQSYEQMELEEQEFAPPPAAPTASPMVDEAVQEDEIFTRRGSILPLLFMMIGAHLFMLGALLLFCSKDGVVTLQWSSKFWFIYCLIGFPILFFGAKMLKSETT
ncbi:MAG: zinc-ribbon domain-containing protein [Simkaniaceae bacterium]|nr:zinc-ribbon domain-containing protein [Simkaniaceae bacterium]